MAEVRKKSKPTTLEQYLAAREKSEEQDTTDEELADIPEGTSDQQLRLEPIPSSARYNREADSDFVGPPRNPTPLATELGEGGDTYLPPGFIGEGGSTATLRQKVEQGKEQIKDKPEDEPAKTEEAAAADATKTFKKIGTGGGTGKAKLPSEVAYDEYVSALNDLKDKEMEAEDPAAQNIYRAAQDKARELYEARENRIAWASLAETIGTGLLKLGMAQTAKKGVDLSRIQWEKPTDWEPTLARYERRYMADVEAARKDYESARDAAEKAKGAEAKNLQRMAELKKDIYQEKLREEEKARDRAAEVEKERLRLEAEKEREKKRDKDAAKREAKQQERADTAARSARVSEARLRFNTDPDIKDLDAEIKKVSGQQSVFDRVSNALQASDLSSKSLDKLDLKLISDAGAAGIDLRTLKDELEKTETVLPKAAGGKSKEEEAAEKKKILEDYSYSFKQALDTLKVLRKQKTKQLLSTIDDPAVRAEVEADVAPTPSAEKKPETTKKLTTVKQLEDFAKREGVTLEVARKTLKNRGAVFEDEQP